MARRRCFAEGFLSRPSYPMIASLRRSAAAGRNSSLFLSLLQTHTHLLSLLSLFLSLFFPHFIVTRTDPTYVRATSSHLLFATSIQHVRRTISPACFAIFLTRLFHRRSTRFTRDSRSMQSVRDAIALIAIDFSRKLACNAYEK